MSLKNLDDVWSHSPQGGTKLLILLAIADGTDATGASMVTPQYIAAMARISVEQLDVLLTDLEESGDIHIYANGAGCLGVNILRPWSEDKPSRALRNNPEQAYLKRITGYVYLLRCGEYCKIGQTTSLSKRMTQLGIQLPHKPQLIHVIATDTQQSLENDLHELFSEHRMNGEWFALTHGHIDMFRQYGCGNGGVIDKRSKSHVYLDGEGFYVPQSFMPEFSTL